MAIELNNDQIAAIYELENWWNSKDKQLFQITGGAGTGKTTVIRYFVERIGLKLSNVYFLAFAGKAASRLAMEGLPGKTIHSAIYDYKERYVRDENGHMVFRSNNKPLMEHYFELKDYIPKKIKLIVVDEASMVSEDIAKDLLSFEIPVVTLGDLNQLPPVFGEPYFLKNPDVTLHQIMRQKEDDPIIWLANQVLAGENLDYGVYGTSAVIRKTDLNDYQFRNVDIVLTGTNKLRHKINNYYRETIKGITNLEFPHRMEKVICVRNDWERMIGENIFLTNGTTGFVDDISKETFTSYNGIRTMEMDFRPDFTNKIFRNVKFDYNHLYNIDQIKRYHLDLFEFAYAITVHKSQGSQWNKVLFMNENFFNNEKDRRKFTYTAITRAVNSIVIVQ